jgi:hypothetical protein
MGRFLETSRQALEDIKSLSEQSNQSNDLVALSAGIEEIADLVFDASEQRVTLIVEADTNILSAAFESALQQIGRRFGISEPEVAKSVARSWISGIHGEWIAGRLSTHIKEDLHQLTQNRQSPRWS